MQSRRSANTTKVFVGSLPATVTTDDLRRLFQPYGTIAECDIANKCGFLHLEDKDLADKAIEELNGMTFMGGKISVEKGRIKPSGRSRRGGPPRGGMGGGSRDRGGPYSRDDGYGRGPRNGYGGGRDYLPYGDDRYGYDRGMPPRGYDSYGGGMDDRRSMYDDRRAFSRSYGPPNGYEPYPPFVDEHPPFGEDDRSAYDDQRLPPSSGSYEDRRPLMGERRPLLEQQSGLGGPPSGPRSSLSSFERNESGSEMFSRRDSGPPKPLVNFGERDAAAGFTSSASSNTAGYSTSPGFRGAGNGPASGYSASTLQTGGYTSTGGYGDTRGPAAAAASTGYGTAAAPGSGYDTRGLPPATAGYADNRAMNTGYGTASATGGYDSYGGNRADGYDTAYPIPQQRGYASGGGGPGSGPRRDMPPGRRF